MLFVQGAGVGECLNQELFAFDVVNIRLIGVECNVGGDVVVPLSRYLIEAVFYPQDHGKSQVNDNESYDGNRHDERRRANSARCIPRRITRTDRSALRRATHGTRVALQGPRARSCLADNTSHRVCDESRLG